MNEPTSLRTLAGLFARLGIIGFGGPAAHIALMYDEMVVRRGWMSKEHFADLIGVTNLIPGPNSTELAIHIGRERAGARGLIVAGACFIAPAMVIVMVLAWLYVRYGTTPAGEALLYGIEPVMIAIVLHALIQLAPTMVRRKILAVLAAAVLVGYLAGIGELLLLFGAGLVYMTASSAAQARSWGLPVVSPLLLAPAAARADVDLFRLFGILLKIGAVLYGSGYVLLAFARSDLVEHLGWLTQQQLVDAVAVGQMTPGPLFTTATFIGYVLGGIPGALVATLGIFLPSFVFVALTNPLVARLRRSPLFSSLLDGVNAAALALMAGVTLQLGRAALIDVPTVLLCGAAALAAFRFRFNNVWLIGAGAVIGLVVRAL